MTDALKGLKEKMAFDCDGRFKYFDNSARSENQRLQAIVLKEVGELVEAAIPFEWLDYHACVTGDCDHTDANECGLEITKILENTVSPLREALAKFKGEK